MDSITQSTRILPSLPALPFGDPHVPGDLWIEIAVKLDPLDVLILAKTCRTLHSLLTEKSVWIRVLRSLMQRLGSFIPSYSPSSMSVEELQRAAAGPQRWRRIGQTADIPHMVPATPARLVPKSLRKWGMPVSDVQLVPGGRFAVTRTMEYSAGNGTASQGTVTLWDLGPPGVTEQVPMSQVADCDLTSEVVHQAPSPEGGTKVSVPWESLIRVAVWWSPSRQYIRTLVLQMSLDGDDHSFVEVGHLDTPKSDLPTIGSLRLHGDHALLFCSPVYRLWNYATHQCCSWRFSDPQGGDNRYRSDMTIDLRDRYVIVATPLSIRVWDISLLEFLPLSDDRCVDARHLSPHATLSSPCPLLSQPLLMSTVGAPHYAPPNSVQFDLFYFTWRGDLQGKAVIRYELAITRLESTQHQLSLIPLAAGHLPSVQYVTNGEDLPGIAFEFTEVLGNEFEGGRGYLYSPINTTFPETTLDAFREAGERSPVTMVLLYDGVPMSSCAFSGRMLYQPRLPTRGEQHLFCADYL